MTERDKFNRDEQTIRIMERDCWRCQYPGCLESATEKAHRIARRQDYTLEVNLLWNQMFNESRNFNWIYHNVINHDLNMSASCRVHNSYMNIGGKPHLWPDLLQKIYNDLRGQS